MQLITVSERPLNLYFKKGKVGDDPNVEERLEEWEDEDNAVKEFVRLFEEVTGNEFEPWEREKKIQKKPLKFYPMDMVENSSFFLCFGGESGLPFESCSLEMCNGSLLPN